MKAILALSLACAVLMGNATAGLLQAKNRQVLDNRSPGFVPCAFTLTSEGSMTYPAWQLLDGQIRLNGSSAPADFYMHDGGRIIDSNGFGCIITDPPTTQVQCDYGKDPMPGFSIDSSLNFLYHGSPNFWACPATDTTYNIYINPHFSQPKCIPVFLKASDCSSRHDPTCSALPPTTAWRTTTVTVNAIDTQTVTVTDVSTSATVTTMKVNSTHPCRDCPKTKTTASTEAPNISMTTKPSCITGCGNGTATSTTSCHNCTMTTLETSSPTSCRNCTKTTFETSRSTSCQNCTIPTFPTSSPMSTWCQNCTTTNLTIIATWPTNSTINGTWSTPSTTTLETSLFTTVDMTGHATGSTTYRTTGPTSHSRIGIFHPRTTHLVAWGLGH